ncbi:hypothetical protein CRENPOLYSF1_230037 [Crenothrix polyspora]|uniref:Uncharacterized protein n=1 Tax=Crenothrix polyspora TaxID=360316 RepID=A0A1R4H756_9GAMM|nr:hypothetical protein CRENPOLYSF1_230037 [Crenothrix polyspora]
MVECTLTRDNCGKAIYSALLSFFFIQERNENIRTLNDIIRNLKKDGLSFSMYIPWFFFINPFWYTYHKNLIAKKNIEPLKKQKNGVMLHYVTCNQLYGIQDSWCHFVCEIYDSGKRINFIDPYKKHIVIDYPKHKTTKIDFESFLSSNHIMLYIYR